MIRPIRNTSLPAPAFIVLDRDQQASHATAETAFVESPADSAQTATAPILRAMPARYRALRPDAAFVAQLIAAAQGLPQTCARRRADPMEAAQAYRVATRAPTNRAEPVAA